MQRQYFHILPQTTQNTPQRSSQGSPKKFKECTQIEDEYSTFEEISNLYYDRIDIDDKFNEYYSKSEADAKYALKPLILEY